MLGRRREIPFLRQAIRVGAQANLRLIPHRPAIAKQSTALRLHRTFATPGTGRPALWGAGKLPIRPEVTPYLQTHQLAASHLLTASCGKTSTLRTKALETRDIFRSRKHNRAPATSPWPKWQAG